MTERAPAFGETVDCSEFQIGLTCFPASARPRGHTAGENACLLVGQFQGLRQLKHPRLCRYFDALIGRDHLVIVASEHYSVNGRFPGPWINSHKGFQKDNQKVNFTPLGNLAITKKVSF